MKKSLIATIALSVLAWAGVASACPEIQAVSNLPDTTVNVSSNTINLPATTTNKFEPLSANVLKHGAGQGGHESSGGAFTNGNTGGEKFWASGGSGGAEKFQAGAVEKFVSTKVRMTAGTYGITLDGGAIMSVAKLQAGPDYQGLDHPMKTGTFSQGKYLVGAHGLPERGAITAT